jgi:hypothetical protein
MRIPAGATVAYPSGWVALRGDRGTATRALLGSNDRVIGYLNLTPRQGDESLRSWASFRIDHNTEEGSRQVTRLEAAGGLRFRTGHGSCIRDRYVTKVGARYVEIACLVEGARTGVVVVAAAPPDRWKGISGELERAISSLTA